NRLVLLVVLGVGAEQLAQRVIDLDALDAEDRQRHQCEKNEDGKDRRLDGDQPHALQPEGDTCSRRLLDLLDVDLTFGVLFEHALSSSHFGLNCSLVSGANAAVSALSERRSPLKSSGKVTGAVLQVRARSGKRGPRGKSARW